MLFERPVATAKEEKDALEEIETKIPKKVKPKKIHPFLRDPMTLKAAVLQIITNQPADRLTISYVAEQLHKNSGLPWKSLKPSYGLFPKYLSTLEEVHVDGSEVFLLHNWHAEAALREEAEAKRRRKKERLARRRNSEIERTEAENQTVVNSLPREHVDKGSACARFLHMALLVVLLLAILTLLHSPDGPLMVGLRLTIDRLVSEYTSWNRQLAVWLMGKLVQPAVRA